MVLVFDQLISIFISVLEMQEVEMGGPCSMNGGEEEHV
jgi:hypothetical protein